MPATPPETPPRFRLTPGILFGIVALCAVVGAVLRFGEAEEFVRVAAEAQPAWLLVAVGLQAATYTAEAGAWGFVLSAAGVPQSHRFLYALSLVELFTNQAMPTAGIAGMLVVVRILERRGVSPPTSMSAMLVDLIGYYVAFGVALASTIVYLGVQRELPGWVLALAGGMWLVGLGISGGIFWLSTPGRVLPPRVRASPSLAALASADPSLVRNFRLIALASLLRLGNFAFDALTLWTCLRAVGQTPTVGQASSAFLIGVLARTLGFVPGGLGTFEAGTLGGLALFGVSVEPGLAAVLLFRGLSFWLPLLPGFWLGRRMTRGSAGP